MSGMTGMQKNNSTCIPRDPAIFAALAARSKPCWMAFPAIVAEKIRQKTGR
jgi:hypothetical protein